MCGNTRGPRPAALQSTLSIVSVILRQPVAVGLDQLVAHGHDVVDGQLRAGMRIQHHGLVDVFFFQRAGRLDGQQLHVDVGAVQRRPEVNQPTTAALRAILPNRLI